MPADNSTKTVPGRPFRQGQSGNPGGRPKIPADVREAIKAACPEAVRVLIELLHSKKEAYRLEAAKTLLDRGYGKPAQMQDIQLDVSGAVGLDAQIRAILIERDKNRFYVDEMLPPSVNADDNASTTDNARAD